MIVSPIFSQADYVGGGYIAGMHDGIVTVGGLPAKRQILLFDATNFRALGQTYSLHNGHYLLMGLNPNKRYLVLCRDYKQEYEPAVWDFVAPSTDLGIEEQQALWESWQ